MFAMPRLMRMEFQTQAKSLLNCTMATPVPHPAVSRSPPPFRSVDPLFRSGGGLPTCTNVAQGLLSKARSSGTELRRITK
jgi:hypothetical protein